HHTPESFLAALRANQQETDALQYLAFALPKREAIWWGCLCVWHVSRPELPAPEAEAVQAVVRWVQEPTEPRRRAAEKASEPTGGTFTRAGCLALAVVLSGGSLAPPGVPAVPPPPHLSAYILAQMMALAAALKQPEFPEGLYPHFLDLGI